MGKYWGTTGRLILLFVIFFTTIVIVIATITLVVHLVKTDKLMKLNCLYLECRLLNHFTNKNLEIVQKPRCKFKKNKHPFFLHSSTAVCCSSLFSGRKFKMSASPALKWLEFCQFRLTLIALSCSNRSTCTIRHSTWCPDSSTRIQYTELASQPY